MFYKKSGYSLLETLIYMALIGVMLAISSSAIISTYRTFNLLRVDRKISINGDAVLEMIIRDTRSSATATTNQGSNTLTIGAITYAVSGSQMTRQDGVSAAQAITGTDVRVTSLNFYKDTSPNSDIISVRMTIESGQGQYVKSKQYYGSAVLRGSYK